MDEWREFIEVFIELWHRGLRDPVATQTQTLKWLLRGYANTEYGRRHSACELLSLAAEPARIF